MKIIIIITLLAITVLTSLAYVENAKKILRENKDGEYKDYGMFIFIIICNWVGAVLFVEYLSVDLNLLKKDLYEVKNEFYQPVIFLIVLLLGYVSIYIAIATRIKRPKLNKDLSLGLKKWKFVPTIIVKTS